MGSSISRSRGPSWSSARPLHAPSRNHPEISLPSATSSCSSKNFHNCLMRGGALYLVLSVAFSSPGVRNGHLPLSCVKRNPIDSNCFPAAATFFLSFFGPLALLVVRSILRNHRLAVRWFIAGCSSPLCGLNFSCQATFDTRCLPTHKIPSEHEIQPPIPLPFQT